jgi:hypothetical protein
MKKTVLALILIGSSIVYADSGTFGQRFGVNGYLTSLPLYYKDRDFNNVKKNQEKRHERKRMHHCKHHDQHPTPLQVRTQ